jgi:hypothetical protein
LDAAGGIRVIQAVGQKTGQENAPGKWARAAAAGFRLAVLIILAA